MTDIVGGGITELVPRTRFDELMGLVAEHDGLLTAKQAREAGIADSVLARLTERGGGSGLLAGCTASRVCFESLVSVSGVVLWAKADGGPQNVALSPCTALRRAHRKGVEIHRADLPAGDVTLREHYR